MLRVKTIGRLRSKIEDKFHTFWSLVKFRGGRAKCLCQFYQFGLGPTLLHALIMFIRTERQV